MAKLKSHSGAKKRVWKTGGGRLVLKRGRRNHLLLQKNKRQKRLPRTLLAHRTQEPTLRKLVPYLALFPILLCG